jgi:hypothetical protein
MRALAMEEKQRIRRFGSTPRKEFLNIALLGKRKYSYYDNAR